MTSKKTRVRASHLIQPVPLDLPLLVISLFLSITASRYVQWGFASKLLLKLIILVLEPYRPTLNNIKTPELRRNHHW